MIDLSYIPPVLFLSKQVGYKWGKSSFLLLNAILYRSTLNEKYFHNLEIILADIVTHIEENNLEGWDDEITDFCRVLFFLNSIGLLDLEDYKFILRPVTEKILNRFYNHHLLSNDFHFVRGILAFGNFFLEAPPEFNNYLSELNLIVDWAEKNRISNDIGCYWINANPNFRGEIFLSSVLGSLSVSKFLFELSNRGNQKADWLLKDSLNFVRSKIRYDMDGLNIFSEPYLINLKNKPVLQWVEGSFTILYSLIIFFKNYLETDEYNFVLHNLQLIADYEEQQVDCSKNSIGQGSMGISLMFEKLYQFTRNYKFRRASVYWRSITLQRLKAIEEDFEEYYTTVRFTGFITGYSGIYTALKLFEKNETHLIDKLIYI